MIFGREPALWMAVITAGIVMAISFGLPVTEAQKNDILTFVATAMALVAGAVVRQNVASVKNLQEKPVETLKASGVNPGATPETIRTMTPLEKEHYDDTKK